MPSITAIGTIWDEAAEADALRLATNFESAWKKSTAARRPDPLDFLDLESVSRGAQLLALLRIDLAQRQRVGESTPVEDYRDRFRELNGDALVALIYEDFCLREEAGESLDVEDYLCRFSEVGGRLREVLEIHELVAEPGSTALGDEFEAVPFPEVGQTIGGFHLVEELGRGSFARVFLAKERQLGDRPVALKVSRTGSREPQTLASLQHTHIVPVHSYRVDPATGLHLLCMPYFGRVTLAQILAETQVRRSSSGVEMLDELDRLDLQKSGRIDSPARSNLTRLPYARAVAWWGARMAEGLQHAHDRGVLHRDVKPSNVLITGDGMPMLLDFNLARGSDFDAVSPSKLGGTLAYMAPEHLVALGQGDDRSIDHRADVYSLGIVLMEMLGVKPTVGPAYATTLVDSLTWLLDHRQSEAPLFIESPVNVPAALESVIRRCLMPEPADRYPSAGLLAADLQAIASDSPLSFAVEPRLPRALRWIRRNRVRVAIAGPMVLMMIAIVLFLFRTQGESLRQESHARELFHDGTRSAERGDYQAAADQFARVADLIGHRRDLHELIDESNRRRIAADEARQIRERADKFFQEAEPLRFALLGFEGDRLGSFAKMAEVLRPFDVGGPGRWIDRPEMKWLDEARRTRLIHEVDDLLFFSVIAQALETSDRTSFGRHAIEYCDLALRFTDRPVLWMALRDWWSGTQESRPAIPGNPALESNAGACFRWYLLAKLARLPDLSIAWLERSIHLDPQNYWHRFALAYQQDWIGRPDLALPPCDAAIALRPNSPRAWKVRSRIHQQQGRWALAVEDLDRSLSVCGTTEDQCRVRLDRGTLLQKLGDFPAAAADYQAVIESGSEDRLARDARRNLARLVADRGFRHRSLSYFDDLVGSDPDDLASRHGRARLLLKMGRSAQAESDLSFLIASCRQSERASLLSERALARLAQDRPGEAENDAREAFRLDPRANHSRLVDRTRLAANLDLDSWPDDPDAFDVWPDGGPHLIADLRSAAERLGQRGHEPGQTGFESRLSRAIVLSAARESEKATIEINRLVASDPRSPRLRRIRAAILERAGQHAEALNEVAAGLAVAVDDANLFELRGKIRVQRQEFESGLADLKVAADRGSASAIGPAMGEALLGLGRVEEAVEVWSKVVQDNPLEARNWLRLARARREAGDLDSGLIALEAASSLAEDGSLVLLEIIGESANDLPARPGRWTRLIDLGRKFILGNWGER